jgi:D-alanyl-lipoteichoic acid acyltransferase DltB (MBOAT superfamily)
MAFIPVYIFILAFTIVVDYFAGIYLERFKGENRKWLLIASLIANIGVLAFFKYFNFFTGNITFLLHHLGFHNDIKYLNIILPIGLSFHTFQAMSYTIEVYKNKQKAEHNFGIYALYVMFYPQLVAGPIERPQNLIHQFHEKHNFSYENFVNGLRLILYGFFLKMVIADNLSLYVDQVYNAPEKFNSISIITALIFYSIQIYCDFGGYSLIAIGCAKVMGFNLMENFRTPYFSRSVSEFWQRWHISLSTWFRDYVYIPCGGNRVKIASWALNIFIVFAISGLWHGANWTFVIWGIAWGFFYIIELFFYKVFSKERGNEKYKFWHILKSIAIFCLATLLWIFFRSEDLHKVKLILRSIKHNFRLSDNMHIQPLIWAMLLLFIIAEIVQYNKRFDKAIVIKPVYIRWAFYLVLLFTIICFAGVENIPFIYFQF